MVLINVCEDDDGATKVVSDVIDRICNHIGRSGDGLKFIVSELHKRMRTCSGAQSELSLGIPGVRFR